MSNPLRKRAQEINEMERGEEIEREFMAQLDAYYSSPASSFYDSKLERKFYEQKLRHLGYTPYPDDGLINFGASGTDKCDLEVYYRNQKIKPEKSDDLPFRGRQRRLGTAVIDFVQLDIIHMPLRLGKAAKFRFKETNKGEFGFEDAAQKRKVFSVKMDDGYSCEFAITCKPDGIMEYGGSTLIFEYKTRATGIKTMNSRLDFQGADPNHVRQVVAESLVYGIDEAIILYESAQKPSWYSDEENKSVTKGNKTWKDGYPVKDMRCFYIYVTDEMKSQLLHDLASQARLVYENQKPQVTVDMTSKCGFCSFRNHCREDISKENLETLQEIESRMSKSHMAGKRDHRYLLEYLEGANDE